jgi:hypothetical protein
MLVALMRIATIMARKWFIWWANQDLIIQDFTENESIYFGLLFGQKRTLCGTFQQIAKQGFLKVRVNGDV